MAAKARSEPQLRFISLAHHVTRERVWENLCRIPLRSAPGVDGQTVAEAKETFEGWIEPMLGSVHRKGYRAPTIRRVYIPKPGRPRSGTRAQEGVGGQACAMARGRGIEADHWELIAAVLRHLEYSN